MSASGWQIMCAAEREYRIKLENGDVRMMTATQIVEETGLGRKMILKRLNQYNLREWRRISASPAEGVRLGRLAFKHGMSGELSSHTAERRRKIEHEKRVLLGNPEIE